jgi:hypothetical protein
LKSGIKHLNIKQELTQDVEYVVDHIQYLKSLVSAVFALENLHIRVKSLDVRKQAGNIEIIERRHIKWL